MSSPTVIIVGTGRSGTSHAAEMCEEMGICMGHNMNPKAKAPRAHHEDYLAHGLNVMMSMGTIKAPHYLALMEQSHKGCAMWGAKDPWFLTWDPKDLRVLAPRLIVRTYRPLEDTLDSWRRIREICKEVDTDEQKAYVRQLFRDREKRCLALEKSQQFNMVRIDYSVKRRNVDVQATIAKGLAP
ncbi:MAG: hypothetical protein GY783_03395 [Gammaproteobacteria bacterium]|nr:hypothetical protein [Gammaproteobacteria bacterium]